MVSVQVKALDFPKTTPSYRRFQTEQIAADIKETILRVSDGPFDAEQNANIPTVNYEVSLSTYPVLFPSPVVYAQNMLRSFSWPLVELVGPVKS